MTAALAERADADPAFADRIDGSALRVLTLKARFGLLTCG
jgi:beta-N-acetylhexosaminidase